MEKVSAKATQIYRSLGSKKNVHIGASWTAPQSESAWDGVSIPPILLYLHSHLLTNGGYLQFHDEFREGINYQRSK